MLAIKMYSCLGKTHLSSIPVRLIWNNDRGISNKSVQALAHTNHSENYINSSAHLHLLPTLLLCLRPKILLLLPLRRPLLRKILIVHDIPSLLHQFSDSRICERVSSPHRPTSILTNTLHMIGSHSPFFPSNPPVLFPYPAPAVLPLPCLPFVLCPLYAPVSPWLSNLRSSLL
jgi:hypothetical protein